MYICPVFARVNVNRYCDLCNSQIENGLKYKQFEIKTSKWIFSDTDNYKQDISSETLTADRLLIKTGDICMSCFLQIHKQNYISGITKGIPDYEIKYELITYIRKLKFYGIIKKDDFLNELRYELGK